MVKARKKKRRGVRFQAFCWGASFLMLRRDPTPSIFLTPLSQSVHRASHLGLMGTLGLNVPSFPSFPLFLSFQNRCHIKDLFSQFLSFSKEFPGIPSVPWVPFLQGSKEREQRKRNLVPRIFGGNHSLTQKRPITWECAAISNHVHFLMDRWKSNSAKIMWQH